MTHRKSFLTGMLAASLCVGCLMSSWATPRQLPKQKAAPEVYSAVDSSVGSYAIPDDAELTESKPAPPRAVAQPSAAQAQAEAVNLAANEMLGATPPATPSQRPSAQVQVVRSAVTEARPHDAALSQKVPGTFLFDPVPDEQVDLIAKRMKLVEDLLRKHKRAYDYRTLTLKDLEKILAGLESAKDSPAPSTTPKPEGAAF